MCRVSILDSLQSVSPPVTMHNLGSKILYVEYCTSRARPRAGLPSIRGMMILPFLSESYEYSEP